MSDEVTRLEPAFRGPFRPACVTIAQGRGLGLRRLGLGLLLSLALQGCDGDATVGPEMGGGDEPLDSLRPAASVEVWPEIKMFFSLGDTVQLTAYAVDSSGATIIGKIFNWSSTDPLVAPTDSSGRVTAMSRGFATITASNGAVIDSALIVVDPERVLRNYCVTCHRTGHVLTGFPTLACPACHSMSLDDADDDHRELIPGHATAAGGFDLIGAHDQAACSTCHLLNNRGELLHDPLDQNDCIACHQNDYDRAHAGTGTPTTCLDCHTVDDWGGAVIDHDNRFFPIYSGKHQGKWDDDCASCHTDPNDFRVFTCLLCHKHEKTKTDEKHVGRPGYIYESNACLACHPDGRK